MTSQPDLVSDLDTLAAELTEAAFSIALPLSGTDWLERKLDLWHAMTQTVLAWERQSFAPDGRGTHELILYPVASRSFE